MTAAPVALATLSSSSAFSNNAFLPAAPFFVAAALRRLREDTGGFLDARMLYK